MMDTLMEADGHVRILVVDDEEIVRDMLFDVLSQAGYTVKTAKDGNDAIAQIENEPLKLLLPTSKCQHVYHNVCRCG
jgi:CheY-like chemotaxis protein